MFRTMSGNSPCCRTGPPVEEQGEHTSLLRSCGMVKLQEVDAEGECSGSMPKGLGPAEKLRSRKSC